MPRCGGFYFPPQSGLASAPRPILKFLDRGMSTKPGEPYLNGRNAPSQPGDEQVGGWPRDQLMRMDARFCERLEHAIANGEEHTPNMKALHFTEQQMTLLRELAAPLAPSQRSAFLKDVARRLHNVVELGDGAVAQA